MQSREGGSKGGRASRVLLPLGDSLLPRDKGSPEGQKANPGTAWHGFGESPLLHLSPWSRRHQTESAHLPEFPLPRAARDADPNVLRFQCLGRFRNPHRTSVCRTQNRQAHIGTEGQGSKPKQPQERDDQEGKRKRARGRDRDQGMGPASFQESQPPCGSCVAHAKRMHAPGDSYTALPGLWVEAGTQAHPSPEV